MSVNQRLHSAGVYIPGSRGNEDNALEFWGRVFQWGQYNGKREFVVAAAESRAEQLERAAQVKDLLNQLNLLPEGSIILFKNIWYRKHHKLAYRFFRELQSLLYADKKKWRVVQLDNGVKGFTW